MDKLFVYALVLSPVPLPAPAKAPPSYWSILREFNVSHQYWSPNGKYVDNFDSEINYTRGFISQANGAPFMEDAGRFPSLEAAKTMERFWLYYKCALRQKAITPRMERDLLPAIEQAEFTHAFWRLVKEANEGEWIHRRTALKKLKDLLGPEDYYAW